ncbi:hypothetical protein ACLI4U_04580 [Natrialbaceae archaeon A-CW2]|uniref:DUF7344 domain-containing protein n=1 Tax=Natronosalvus amylolyticus TaxID=2961994 RepID=UPI0028804A35|nr:hypothetical protein [Natronosalvus amylolyticus]
MTDPAASNDHPNLAHDAMEWLENRSEPNEHIDEVFSVLAAQRRRLLLEVLVEYEREMTLPDAAEEVAQRETGRSITDLSAQQVSDIYISLYHDHLPRLVSAGLLEYEQENDLVALATA